MGFSYIYFFSKKKIWPVCFYFFTVRCTVLDLWLLQMAFLFPFWNVICVVQSIAGQQLAIFWNDSVEGSSLVKAEFDPNLGYLVRGVEKLRRQKMR